MKAIFTGFLFLFANSAFAQENIYEAIYWDSKPSIHQQKSSDLDKFPGYYILREHILELVIEMEAKMFDSEHVIIHINNDAGVEKYNKVYIPLYGNRQMISLKVRSISPDNKVTEFNQSNLKELKNVENYGNFKIFAIEGVTKGCEIEYSYTLKTNPQSYGREIIQKDVPVLKSNFALVYPKRVNFLAKSYNGLQETKHEMFDKKRDHIHIEASDIPSLAEEQYSSYRGSLMRIDFRLEKNAAGEKITWNSIFSGVVKSMYDKSKLTKLIKSINVEGLAKEPMIRKIEEHVKANFTINQSREENYEDLKSILSSRVANERGIAKLYFNLFKELKIENEMVFTCARSQGSIDPEFSSFVNLFDELFYFKDLKMYLDPTKTYTRLGAAPVSVAGNVGMFVSDFRNIGNDIVFTNYSTRNIELLDYTLNDEGVTASVTFDDNLSKVMVAQENRWQGYRALSYRGVYFYRTQPKDKEDFLQNITLSGIDNYSIQSRHLEGELVDFSKDPKNYMTVRTNFTASSLIEKAGSDNIFLIGKIIGRQSELYQETERKTDIEFREISNYNHEISVTIPKGYKCSGLEALKISNKVIDNGKEVMYFNSDYTLSGNKLAIRISEVYKTLSLPKSKYEEFRKMVNSASDFNKVAIVFQPE
jgi:hypothetical protein